MLLSWHSSLHAGTECCECPIRYICTHSRTSWASAKVWVRGINPPRQPVQVSVHQVVREMGGQFGAQAFWARGGQTWEKTRSRRGWGQQKLPPTCPNPFPAYMGFPDFHPLYSRRRSKKPYRIAETLLKERGKIVYGTDNLEPNPKGSSTSSTLTATTGSSCCKSAIRHFTTSSSCIWLALHLSTRRSPGDPLLRHR